MIDDRLNCRLNRTWSAHAFTVHHQIVANSKITKHSPICLVTVAHNRSIVQEQTRRLQNIYRTISDSATHHRHARTSQSNHASVCIVIQWCLNSWNLGLLNSTGWPNLVGFLLGLCRNIVWFICKTLTILAPWAVILAIYVAANAYQKIGASRPRGRRETPHNRHTLYHKYL